MEPVSAKWRQAQRQTIVPASFVEINFSIGNSKAKTTGEVTENGNEYFANAQEIIEEIAEPVKYAMLEPGLWVLNGTYRLVGGSIEPLPLTGYELITSDGFYLTTFDNLVLTVRKDDEDYAG